MKWPWIFMVFAWLGTALGISQTTFHDSFESYPVAALIAQNSSVWTTWSGNVGGPEDAPIDTLRAADGSQSLYFHATSVNGGPQDVVLPFGGKHSTGQLEFYTKMYVEAGEGAYFNLQADTLLGAAWALDCFFDQNGNLRLANSLYTYYQGSYPIANWFDFALSINLNTHIWEFALDGQVVATFSNSVGTVAALDIYPANLSDQGGNGLSTFWLDSLGFSHTPFVFPNLNAGALSVGVKNPANLKPGTVLGYDGQQRYIAAQIRNLGLDTIRSIDLAYSYNGGTFNHSLAGLQLASLEEAIIDLPIPISLALGNWELELEILSLNGLGKDQDSTDDKISRWVNISHVAAVEKAVFLEEATSTYCQWCPRGAVFMNYLDQAYAERAAIVAVHHDDPMLQHLYNTPFRTLFSGYPKVVLDRNEAVDPLDVELALLDHLAEPAKAKIIPGAQISSTGQFLEISLVYDFLVNTGTDHHILCILGEDSVSGRGFLWQQENAYAANAAGPMAGYENLPSLIPDSLMHYDFVLRTFSPNFAGGPGWNQQQMAGDRDTFNFRFNRAPDWALERMFVVGLLLDSMGHVNNAVKISLDSAMANGFVRGEIIMGNDLELANPAKLFPNPSEGQCQLQLPDELSEMADVELVDLQGRILQKEMRPLNGNAISLDYGQIPPGIYVLRWKTELAAGSLKLFLK